MKPKTELQKAKEAGLSKSQFYEAKANGVDTDDPTALKLYRANLNTRADSRNTPPSSPSMPSVEMTIEEMELALRAKGITTNEARTLKIQIEGMKQIIQIQKERGQLISREEVEESDAKIAHAVAAMLRKLESEIPAICFGQHDMGKLKESVLGLTRPIQQAVADGQEAFWKQHTET